MANYLGLMSVKLAADYATLQSDLGRAVHINDKAMADIARRAEAMGRTVGTALAVIGPAVTAAVVSAINSMDRLDEAAQRVGISAKQLSTLEYAAKRGAVEAEVLEKSLVKLAKSASDTAAGTGSAAKGFAHLGVEVKNADGSLKSTEQLLKETATEFAKYEDSAQKTAVAVNIFGKAGADMIPLLNLGADGISELQDRARELGLEIGNETAAAAGEFNDALDDLRAMVRGLGNDIAADVLPQLTRMANALVDSGVSARGAESDYSGIGDTIIEIGEYFAQTAREVEALTNVIAAAVDTVGGAGDVLNGLLSNLTYAGKSIAEAASGNFAQASEDARLAGVALADGWEKGTSRIAAAWGSASAGIDDATAKAAETIAKLNAPLDESAERAEQFKNVIGGTGEYVDRTKKQMGAFAEETKKVASEQREAEKAAAALAKAQDAIVDAMSRQRASESPEMEAVETFNQAMRDAQRNAEGFAEAGIPVGEVSAYIAGEVNMAAAALERKMSAIEADRAITEQYVAELQDEARIIGLTTAQQRAETVVLRALEEANRKNTAAVKEVVKVDEARLRSLAKINEALNLSASINDASKSPILEMVDQAKELGDAIKAAFEEGMDPEIIAPMQKAVEKLNAQVAIQTVGSYKALLGAMQTFTKEGSKGFKAIEKGMAALQIVQDIIALKAAVNAVLTQGQGDPYSAWARMAAMAAAVAPFIASIGLSLKSFGGSGSGFSDSSAARQASQGTGSVLGDSTAKSESILNAVEITANATQQLVGLNRGMLNALLALQDGIGSASGMLARGAADADFSGMNLAVGQNQMFTALDFAGILGGKSKITDQGIVIMGGALSELIENISVGAFQEVKSKSWRFGSTHTRTGIQDITDQVGRQFELIIASIADTVREGAIALGMLPSEIEAALAAFRVEEIKISLKGLDAEEQQKELEAVFSRLFDNLAGSVAPWVEQFQQVGEGLGETLVRVATGVQVTREAVRYLGFALDETNPEKFAQVSEGLLDLVGGIDAMIEGMTAFVNAFGPANHLLQVSADSLTTAFGEVGLKLPETRDAMWALMQSLDATTESGREQIATLIRLASAASEYYSLIDKAEKARLDYAIKSSDLMTELGMGGGFVAARAEIERWTTDTIDALNDLARAAGRAGASERDLVNVHSVAAQRIAALIAKLKEESRDLAVTLGYITGGNGDTIESLNAQIASMGQASMDTADAIGQAVDGMREKMNLLLGDLSPFNDQRKLELALEGLRAGTVDASQVLEIGRRLYASTSNYTNLFNQVMGMAGFGSRTLGEPTMPGGSAGMSGDDRTLSELIAARDALLAAQRPEIADQLARRLAELSYATGEDFAELAEGMGWTLEQLGADLGLSDEKLQEYLQALTSQFEAQDWSALGDTITNSFTTNTDRIVAAIENREIENRITQADARMAEIDRQMVAQDRVEERLVAIETAINGQTSALISSGAVNTASQVAAQHEIAQELREVSLMRRAETPRRGGVLAL